MAFTLYDAKRKLNFETKFNLNSVVLYLMVKDNSMNSLTSIAIPYIPENYYNS